MTMNSSATYIKLGDICNIHSGGTPRRGVDGYYGGTIPWAKIGDIENAENGYLINTNESITEAGLKAINNRIFPKDTVFLAMYGSVGKTAIAGKKMSTNQAILGLQPKCEQDVDVRYLKFWLDYSKDNFIRKARGVALQNISATIVKDSNILLPSFEEQKKIVKLLDHADSLRQKRKVSIKMLDEYLKSVFLDMFGETANDYESWNEIEIQKLAEDRKGSMRTGPFGSDLKHSEFVNDGIAVLGIDNAVENKFEWKERRFISEEKYNKLKRYTVHPRDVLITIMATIGRSAVVPNNIPKAINTKHLATITLDAKKANPYFISYSIHSNPQITRQIQRKNIGAIMPGLNLGIIKSLKLKNPPINLQNKFENTYHYIQDLKSKMLLQSEELDNQFQALMQRSFN